jgi:hypothetical protein
VLLLLSEFELFIMESLLKSEAERPNRTQNVKLTNRDHQFMGDVKDFSGVSQVQQGWRRTSRREL